MSKKLIVVMALSLVLVSGGLFSARADCAPCGWHLPSCWTHGGNDMDRSNPNSPYNSVGPNMGNGSPGYPWFRGK
jgi:hypothetical protein